MRILFDAHQIGHQQTGNETWARNVLSFLPEHLADADLHVAITDKAGAQREQLDAPAQYHMVSRRSGPRVAVDLPALARSIRPDVIFTQYQMALSRLPAVVLVHDISAEDPESRAWLPASTRLRYRASVRSSARFANRLLTVSEFTKKAMIKKYGLSASAIAVAPNAVEPALLELLTARSVERVPGLVLAVGNVLPRKNLVTLAKAVRTLVDEGDDVRLRVVGQVPPAGKRDAAAMEALLGERVQFTGYLSLEQLAESYQQAAVLGFPSRYEGFGIPVLEAMAAGTPVVVSDRTALPEVAGNAALVVQGSDPAQWRDGLQRVLADVGCRDSLVEAGRKRVSEFSWHRSAGVVAASLRSAARRMG